MIKKFGILVLLVVSLMFVVTLLAQTAEKSENNSNGIKEIRPGFQVFPEGKLGNTLYYQKKKLVSREDLVLQDVEEAPDGYVYYGTNQTDEGVLGYVGSETVVFTKLNGGYYQLVTQTAKKRLYRVSRAKEIQNLLPRSNTASGLVYNNINKAAFFHITKGENVETEDGKERYQCTFKLHIVKDGDNRIITLPDAIIDFQSTLKLNWIDQNTLQYTLSNGQKETIVVK
jgi:hypothetical protein